MGNALRYLYKNCCKPSTADESESLGHHGVSTQTVGVSALAQDLLHFEVTSQVPHDLSKHVVSSKNAQSNWYKKLLQAWKGAKHPPKTPEEAARLIIQTLKNHQTADVEGLLAFYGLPLPHTLVQLSTGVPSSLPHGVKFELHTLPVDVKAVADGDTITVYVNAADPRESSLVPKEVHVAALQRAKARAERNYTEADALHKKIIDQNYRMIQVQHKEVLAKKYRIRLRGIDAPESAMPYGKQAKEELAKLVQGKCVQVFVYEEDRYGRSVGDIYCNGIFAQWEKEARAKRIGLWASSNPEEPWNWRKDRREGRHHTLPRPCSWLWLQAGFYTGLMMMMMKNHSLKSCTLSQKKEKEKEAGIC